MLSRVSTFLRTVKGFQGSVTAYIKVEVSRRACGITKHASSSGRYWFDVSCMDSYSLLAYGDRDRHVARTLEMILTRETFSLGVRIFA